MGNVSGKDHQYNCIHFFVLLFQRSIYMCFSREMETISWCDFFFFFFPINRRGWRWGVNTRNDVLRSEGLSRDWLCDWLLIVLNSPNVTLHSLYSPPSHSTSSPPHCLVQFQLKPFRASLFSHLLSRESQINKSMNPASTGLWALQDPVFFLLRSPCQSKETLISWNTLMHCVMHRRMFIKLFSNESQRIDSGAWWFMHPHWLLLAMLICAIGRGDGGLGVYRERQTDMKEAISCSWNMDWREGNSFWNCKWLFSIFHSKAHFVSSGSPWHQRYF